MLQTCMYRLHTHAAACGISTSMPLLGLLACLCLHFPCERPRPSLNRSPVTASRAPYQQASCYPNFQSRTRPEPTPASPPKSTPTSSKVAQSIFVFLAVLELTQTSLPKPPAPSASNCIAPLAPHLLSHCSAAAPRPRAASLLHCFAASSLSIAFAAHLHPPPPFAAPLAGLFGIAGQNPRIQSLSSVARPLTCAHHGGQNGAVQTGGAGRWWCWQDGLDYPAVSAAFRRDGKHKHNPFPPFATRRRTQQNRHERKKASAVPAPPLLAHWVERWRECKRGGSNRESSTARYMF